MRGCGELGGRIVVGAAQKLDQKLARENGEQIFGGIFQIWNNLFAAKSEKESHSAHLMQTYKEFIDLWNSYIEVTQGQLQRVLTIVIQLAIFTFTVGCSSISSSLLVKQIEFQDHDVHLSLTVGDYMLNPVMAHESFQDKFLATIVSPASYYIAKSTESPYDAAGQAWIIFVGSHKIEVSLNAGEHRLLVPLQPFLSAFHSGPAIIWWGDNVHVDPETNQITWTPHPRTYVQSEVGRALLDDPTGQRGYAWNDFRRFTVARLIPRSVKPKDRADWLKEHVPLGVEFYQERGYFALRPSDLPAPLQESIVNLIRAQNKDFNQPLTIEPQNSPMNSNEDMPDAVKWAANPVAALSDGYRRYAEFCRVIGKFHDDKLSSVADYFFPDDLVAKRQMIRSAVAGCLQKALANHQVSLKTVAAWSISEERARWRQRPQQESPKQRDPAEVLRCWRTCRFENFRNQAFNCLSGRPDETLIRTCSPQCGDLSRNLQVAVCE